MRSSRTASAALLTNAEGLATMGLLPGREVARIRAGFGAIDAHVPAPRKLALPVQSRASAPRKKGTQGADTDPAPFAK